MTYVDQVLSWMPKVFKPQKKAFIALLGALMCFTGRATMRNLSKEVQTWPVCSKTAGSTEQELRDMAENVSLTH